MANSYEPEVNAAPTDVHFALQVISEQTAELDLQPLD